MSDQPTLCVCPLCLSVPTVRAALQRLRTEVEKHRASRDMHKERAGDWEVRAVAAEDEVERLRGWKEEAVPILAGLQDLGHALGVPLGHSITGPETAEKARALTAEIERLRGRVDSLDREVRSRHDQVMKALGERDRWHERWQATVEAHSADMARLEAVREALSRHPRVCEEHPDGDPITCGWKRTVADIEHALTTPTKGTDQ